MIPVSRWLGRKSGGATPSERLHDLRLVDAGWRVSGWLLEPAGPGRGAIRAIAAEGVVVAADGWSWELAGPAELDARRVESATPNLQTAPALCPLWAPAFGVARPAEGEERSVLAMFGGEVWRAGARLGVVCDLLLEPAPWRLAAVLVARTGAFQEPPLVLTVAGFRPARGSLRWEWRDEGG